MTTELETLKPDYTPEEFNTLAGYSKEILLEQLLIAVDVIAEKEKE